MEPERTSRREKPPFHHRPGVDARHPALQQVKHLTHTSYTYFILQQLLSLPRLSFLSADDDFDSTFKTNVLVNSSGYAEYLPPGELLLFLNFFYSCSHCCLAISPSPITSSSPCGATAASQSAISARLLCLYS